MWQQHKIISVYALKKKKLDLFSCCSTKLNSTYISSKFWLFNFKPVLYTIHVIIKWNIKLYIGNNEKIHSQSSLPLSEGIIN